MTFRKSNSAIALMMGLGLMLSTPVTTQAQSPAGAETNVEASWSYGIPEWANALTDGGAGGEVIKVTTTASDGPGSLREALSATGPRIVVFEVGGVINLDGDNILIENSDLTIAGQTAPSPGVSLIKGGLIIAADDVIVQHLRIRPGDLGEDFRSGRDIDAITTSAASNVIVDHCSLSWATDENLSASGPRFTGDTPEDWSNGTSHNIVFSNNIVAEGLSYSTHAKGEHSKGSLIHDNVADIVIYGNLYAHNFERSPLFKGGVQGAIMNNLIYDPGQRAIHYNLQELEWGKIAARTGHMSVMGNVMRAGPSTIIGLPMIMLGGEGNLDLYREDNISVDRWGQAVEQIGRYTTGPASITEVSAPDLPDFAPTPMPAVAVEAYVLSHVGARPWDRDGNDVRVLADTAEGRGEIIDSQSEVGGYPVAETVTHAFDAADWVEGTMAPATETALDSGAAARGT